MSQNIFEENLHRHCLPSGFIGYKFGVTKYLIILTLKYYSEFGALGV